MAAWVHTLSRYLQHDFDVIDFSAFFKLVTKCNFLHWHQDVTEKSVYLLQYKVNKQVR